MTGAGVSAESGVPTFRDSNGLWEGHDIEQVATPMGFAEDPKLVWKFYSERRVGVKGVKPNAGHYALTELERKLGDRFQLITQNVDDLHERAGSTRIGKLHGNLLRTKCSKYMTCPYAAADDKEYLGELPVCPLCGAVARPDIVWFYESLDPFEFDKFDSFVARTKIKAASVPETKLYYIAVGTSGVVAPASHLVYHAASMGAKTYLVNRDETAQESAFDVSIRGLSGEVLPQLFE